uniref:Putative secreted protein n=1 Tax=Anopheles triannulatus TaxID=58253 RepID=A0A2M4B1V3_9DIPT
MLLMFAVESCLLTVTSQVPRDGGKHSCAAPDMVQTVRVNARRSKKRLIRIYSNEDESGKLKPHTISFAGTRFCTLTLFSAYVLRPTSVQKHVCLIIKTNQRTAK